MKFLTKIPLKYYLPLTYVVTGIIIGFVTYLFSIAHLEKNLKDHELVQFKTELNTFQGRLDYLTRMNKKLIDREIADIASLEHVSDVKLMSYDGTILESSDSYVEQEQVEKILSTNIYEMYKDVKNTLKTKIVYDKDKLILYGLCIVRFPSSEIGEYKNGVLLITKDITDYVTYRKSDELYFIIELVSIYMFIMLIINYISYTNYIRRIQKILSTVKSFKSGNLSDRIDIDGHDEISDLADGINEFKNEIQRQQIDLNEKISFLNDYKKVVDESSIVSIADKKGLITYINDSFVEVSGYSRDELLGKPHNIVRHPDIPKYVFKELWETIQSGNVWKGTVKNRKKDGSSYWVDAVIMPIMSHENEIVEYISVRHDITDRVNLYKEIEETQKEIIFTVGAVSETRSKETGEHVKRVAEYSKLLALHYGLTKEEAETLKSISPMHDIGKVGIPDDILKKPGKLTDDEFEIMKTHSSVGHAMLKNSNQKLLRLAAIVAHQHHENWDGTGYPQNLKGKDIHIYGRISALADVFDALGSDRVYKKAWNDKEILTFIKEQRGKKFDPNLVDIFFKHFEEIDAIRKKFS